MALDGRDAVTSYPTPLAAWEAFAAAIAARDPDGARRAATTGAWRGRGDSARLVYETATEDDFRITVSGLAWIEGDRAVLPVSIERAGRSTTLYALLEQRDGAWSVSAGVRDERHASLFLAGVLPAIFEVSDLSPSPEGEQWARARDEEVRASIAVEGQQVKLLGIHALPQRNRVVVGVRHLASNGRPVQEWVCLDTSGGAPQVLGRSSYPNLGLLLTGIQATMPAREEPVSGAADKRLDAEDWKIINTALQALAELARNTPPLAGQPRRTSSVLAEAIARALEGAGQHSEAAALRQKLASQPASASTGDDAQHTEPEIPSPDELEPVRHALQQEIDAFRKEKAVEPATSILDESFLAEHGQELAGRLLRVLANTLPLLRPTVQNVPASDPGTPS